MIAKLNINQYRSLWVGIVVFLFNIVYRLLFIDAQSIAGDEPFSIYVAQMSTGEIIRLMTTGNNPPLWELMLHFWIKIFGTSALSVRFLPFLFSCLSAVFLFRTGEKFFNMHVAVTATLLFTFSNFHTHLSHEARCYPLFTLLSTASMYYFMQLLSKQDKSNKHLLIWTGLNILLIYTHFFGWWILLVQAVMIVWEKLIHKNKALLSKRLFIGLCAACLLFAPYMNIAWNRLESSMAEGTWLSEPNGIFSIIEVLRTFTNEEYGQTTALGTKPVLSIFLLLVALAGYAIAGYKNRTVKISSLQVTIVVWLTLPLAGIFLLSYLLPMFHDRYLIFISTAYYLFLAAGIYKTSALIPNKFIVPGLAIAGMIITSTPNPGNKREVVPLVNKVKQLRRQYPKAPVLICPHDFRFNFMYYFNTECFGQISTATDFKKAGYACLKKYGIYPVFDTRMEDTTRITSSADVIYIDAAANFIYPENGFVELFNRHYSRHELFEYPEIFKVYVYHK